MKVGAAFAQTLASQVVQSLASVATGVVIARGLGPQDQGRYATFAAGIALGAFVVSLGQFHGNVLAAANQRVASRVLVLRAAAHAAAVFVVLACSVALWSHWLPLRGGTMLVFLFVLVLSSESAAQMLRGINLGQHQVTGWNVATLSQRLLLLLVVSAIAWRSHLGLESVLWCWAVSTFASVVVSVVWIWRHAVPSPTPLASIWADWGAGLALGARAFVTIALTLLLVRADIWMLGPMLGSAAVGQMSVATTLAEWLWYVPSVLSNLLFAVVAASRERRSVEQVARSARLVTAVSVLLMFALLLGGSSIVRFLYGPAYEQAGLLFTVLLPGMTALSVHLIVDAYFAGSGFPPITFWGALAALLAKVALNLVAVPAWGAIGAAASTNLAYGGLLMLKIVWLRRATGLRATDLLIVNGSDLRYLKERIRPVVSR